ncbi:hypothetical protein [Actinomadura sp. SCN-SB]|uniref:hypothetical protein n=1 Tax=Actinomadura sp. SCN-SB TaxID=3373092 RepID=UPI003753AEE3
MAALKALLSGRPDEHERLIDEIERVEGPDAGGRHSVLIAAGMFEAAEKRFIRNGRYASKEEIIAYVASVRSRSEAAANDLDAMLAERVLLAALDQGEIDDIDDEAVVMTQLLLMAALVGDEEYSEEELDGFLALVRRTADEWLEP